MKPVTQNFKSTFQTSSLLITGFFVLNATVVLSKPAFSDENQHLSKSFIAGQTPTTTPAISTQELQWIGQRIYANECASKPENLIHWNTGENFPSLGIGHFIWYSKNANERFIETFPAMVDFVGRYQAPPEWLLALKPLDSPWRDKQSFENFKNTSEYQSLLKWLVVTQSYQAEFISQQLNVRFNAFFVANKTTFSTRETGQIKQLFSNMMNFKKGRFAIIDYANFKGIGAKTEAYQGEQWGLISVLEDMLLRHPEIYQRQDMQVLQEFVLSAKRRLQKRVNLSPQERGEERWLKGWFKRLDGYLKG